MGAASIVPAHRALDHLLLGVPDLERGIAWVERLTGVRTVVGGSHPGRGTRNALLSLGARQYLEIIAPDPAQSGVTPTLDLKALPQPRLVNWAAATADIDGLAARARAAGRQVRASAGEHEMLEPRDGSRVRPDGATLKWRTLGVPGALGRGPVNPLPFFIQWTADSRHPSEDSPAGCTLQSFRIAHPTPAAVADALKPFDIELDLTSAAEPALFATLRTPKGVIELG
jgi:hypothetical protein